MGEWQPIETAPRDVDILVWSERYYDRPVTAQWDDRYGWSPSWDDSLVIEYMSDFGTEYKALPVRPTHWMPLPEPPK